MTPIFTLQLIDNKLILSYFVIKGQIGLFIGLNMVHIIIYLYKGSFCVYIYNKQNDPTYI